MIDEEMQRELNAGAFRLRPGKVVWCLARDWGLVVLFVCLSVFSADVWIYLLAILGIGSRMHSLATLFHDAAHGLWFSNKGINDTAASVFVGWPLFVSLRRYRQLHYDHHRYANTLDDPDWARARPDRLAYAQGYTGIFRMLLGVDAIRSGMAILFRGAGRKTEGNQRKGERYSWGLLVLLPLFIVFLLLFPAIGKLFFLYWVIPYFLVLFPLMRLRGISEHWAVCDDGPLNATRTVIPGFMERFFVYPNNVSYHLEHHLFPRVPFYNLARVHRSLMDNDRYNERAHITYGLSGVLREILEYSGRGRGIHGG